MDEKSKTIRQTVFFWAKPEEVYDAILDPRKQHEFTKQEATTDQRVGGKYTRMDGYIFGKNLVLEKGKKIVQDLKTTEWSDGYPPSTVQFTFRGSKTGTRLTMVHSKVPPEQAEHFRKGWLEYFWEPLDQYFRKTRADSP